MSIGDQYFDKVSFVSYLTEQDAVFNSAQKFIKDYSANKKRFNLVNSSLDTTNGLVCSGSGTYARGQGFEDQIFNIGANQDFCIEFQVNFDANTPATTGIFSNGKSGVDEVSLCRRSDGTLDFRFAGSLLNINYILTTDSFWYVAISRVNGVVRGFANGAVSSNTLASTAGVAESEVAYLGYCSSQNAFANMKMRWLRVTLGTGRYSAAYSIQQMTSAWLYYSQIEGTVKDANGNFAQRLVRAHRRADGAIVSETLSNPSTGAFTLNCPDASKHYAVVHDSDAWITYLPFNGDNNSTIFPEWGGKKVTAYGNAKISTAQSKFGGASAYFGGAGDYVALSPSSDITLGNGDFTVEFWAYFASSVANQSFFEIYADASNRWNVGLLSSNIQFFSNLAATGSSKITAAAPSNNTWHHIALCRSGSTFTLYVDGISVGTSSSTTLHTATSALSIGRAAGGGGADYVGYIDDLRISKGVARYVGNFTPASVPHFTEQAGDPYWNNVVLAMHMDGQPDNGDQYRNNVVLNMRGNDLTDDTGKVVTANGNVATTTVSGRTAYGGKAISFDGSGDSLALNDSDGFTFSGDFTIEVWCYLNSLGGETGVVSHWYAGGASNCSFVFSVQANGRLRLSYGIGGSNINIDASTTTVTTGAWTHLAVTRSGTEVRLFVGGVLDGTVATVSGAFNNCPDRLGVGCVSVDRGTGSYLNGYIDDLRITKGVARYTANFTPPTAELPALQRAFPDVKSGKVVTANGDVVISSTQSKFGGYSAYFDGSGDYLATPNFALHSTDFTIEGFIRLAVNNTNQIICATYNSPTQANTFTFSVNNTGKLNGGNGLTSATGVTTLSTGVWYHVAFVYTHSTQTINIFVDGVLNGTVTSAQITASASNFYIGGSPGDNNIGTHWFNGNIDDLRVTKGIARYTANFTPPAAPFPETLQTYGQQNAMIYDHLTPV